jgi:hypothetical protein
MKQQIIKTWIQLGYKKSALRLNKILRVNGQIVELLNLKHGVITYVNLKRGLK